MGAERLLRIDRELVWNITVYVVVYLITLFVRHWKCSRDVTHNLGSDLLFLLIFTSARLKWQCFPLQYFGLSQQRPVWFVSLSKNPNFRKENKLYRMKLCNASPKIAFNVQKTSGTYSRWGMMSYTMWHLDVQTISFIILLFKFCF